jgi:hypothetical protein
MTKKEEILKRSLYNIAKFDVETPNYLKYNNLLWSDILALDIEAVEEAIIQLMECNQ